MPTFTEVEFDEKMIQVREFLTERTKEEGIPMDQLVRVGSRIAEMDPARYVFNDGGAGAQAEFKRLLSEEGMTDHHISRLGHILHDMQYDRFRDFFGQIAYNTYIPGPVITSPPPELENLDKNQAIVLGDFDFENVLGDSDDSTNVTSHRIVNPCMLTVVGPEGAPVDYALPGWSCVVAGLIVGFAALGDSSLGLLKRVEDGFRRAGRELKRFGKRIKKAFKDLF